MTAPNPTTSGQPACTAAQLTISIHGGTGGAGHGGKVIHFLNGGKTCVVHGYPGLDAVNSSGQVVVHAKRTATGYLGGPGLGATTGAVTSADIVLTPGHEASALFEGWNGPVDSLGPCPSYTAVLVTPPNETHSAQVASDYTLCYLEVHPVVAGGTGGAVDYSP